MYLYHQNANIVRDFNVQRLESPHINRIFVETKDSIIDSEIRWYRQFTQAIGRQEFRVKGYLTWSEDQFLESPGQTYIQRGNDNKSKVLPFMCCYFSIDAYHNYYIQGWSRDKSTIVLGTPDLIPIWYGQMRIFSGDFSHGGGFNNTSLNGNFNIQLSIIKEGQRC